VWPEVAGIRKGRIYGLGSESSLFASRQNYRGSSSSSTEWVQKHEFEKLKFERVELRDMVKQLMKSLNFQPKSYTRDQVHEDDVVDDNEDIVDNNDDNEDVVDNNDDNSDDNSDDNDGMSDDDELE
jgi:copper oxidase (laccase) domain-containing protein